LGSGPNRPAWKSAIACAFLRVGAHEERAAEHDRLTDGLTGVDDHERVRLGLDRHRRRRARGGGRGSAVEVRVIKYLPTNLRAPEIASDLFVSTNTIRTHLRHIYAKLGVHGRAEAVARARGLGLLAPSRSRR
jgi:ATP/maltotriose-dependent transcriptional regulator MalT